MTERAKTLMRYSKEELAEKCDILELNNQALKEGLEIQYKNCLALFDAKTEVYKTFERLMKIGACGKCK